MYDTIFFIIYIVLDIYGIILILWEFGDENNRYVTLQPSLNSGKGLINIITNIKDRQISRRHNLHLKIKIF